MGKLKTLVVEAEEQLDIDQSVVEYHEQVMSFISDSIRGINGDQRD